MILGRNIEEERLIKKFIKYGHEHIFYFWQELGDKEKDEFINELQSIDLKKINEYFRNFKKQKTKEYKLEPTEYLSIKQKEKSKDLKSIGDKSLRSNQIGFLTVAGGQGSRLGYDHPKGCFPISPVKKKSLFQIFAEKIKFYSNYYKNDFNWYIMTSKFNYQETMDFFEKNNYFKLNKNNIFFFKQGMLPSLTLDGKLILSERNRLFLNPDGHGGVLKALLNSGLLHKMKDKGIKHLSYFQVDNPMVKMADPYFIGHHIQQKSMVSSKVIAKLYPEEKLGAICKKDKQNCVIEYSDLSKKETYAKNSEGQLKYLMGSIAIHIFDIKFLLNFTKKMPIHFAKKKINGYAFTENHNPIIKDVEGIKFETFVFDSIPLAKKSVFFETERDIEFYPVKNKTGLDSIETCIQGQSKLFVRWLSEAGLCKAEYNEQKVEISPGYAPDKELFLEKVQKKADKIKKIVFDNNGNLNEQIYIE